MFQMVDTSIKNNHAKDIDNFGILHIVIQLAAITGSSGTPQSFSAESFKASAHFWFEFDSLPIVGALLLSTFRSNVVKETSKSYST